MNRYYCKQLIHTSNNIMIVCELPRPGLLVMIVYVRFLKASKYSQTSLIRSSFIQIPRHPEENPTVGYRFTAYAMHTYIQYGCSIIRFPRQPDIFFFGEKRMCAVMRGLTVVLVDIQETRVHDDCILYVFRTDSIFFIKCEICSKLTALTVFSTALDRVS